MLMMIVVVMMVRERDVAAEQGPKQAPEQAPKNV